MKDSIVRSEHIIPEDRDTGLRPLCLDDFQGQTAVKENLSVFIKAARERGRRGLDGQRTVVHRTRVRSASFASDLSKAAGMAYSRLADRCCNVGNRAHARDKSDQQLNFCTVMKRKLLLDFINASL